MAQRNKFQKLEAKDYNLFLKYYKLIEYSYFADGDPTPKAVQEEKTKMITRLSEEQFTRNVTKAQYESLLRQADFYLYRDKANDQVIGIIAFSATETRELLSIHEFFILKEYQRMGLGKMMYEDFLYLLKDNWFFKVRINMICSFAGAEEFWKKMGYKCVGSEKVNVLAEKRYYAKIERLSTFL